MATTEGISRSLFGELPATKVLVGLCALVFAAMVATDQRLPISLAPGPDSFRISTLYRFGALSPALVGAEPWRLVSAVYVHFSLIHAGLNLWGLFSLGRLLETRFGAARSLFIFVAAGVLGFVASVAWDGFASYERTAGASGGVFGQLGAVIGLLLARRHPGWKNMLFENLLFAVAIGYVARVNHAAHLGGFLVGFGLGLVLEKEKARPVITKAFGILAALGLVVSVASVALSTVSPTWREVRQIELLRGD